METPTTIARATTRPVMALVARQPCGILWATWDGSSRIELLFLCRFAPDSALHSRVAMANYVNNGGVFKYHVLIESTGNTVQT